MTTPEKITPGYRLPDMDVTFEAYKFEYLHRQIMDAATHWALGDKQRIYSGLKFQEAKAYVNILCLVLIGVVPGDVYTEVTDEYDAMLFGGRPKRKGREAKHEQDQR